MWDWGDGATSIDSVTESGGVGTAIGSHSYSSAGVYTITVTVTDNLAESGSATSQFVVVYDPSAGFVTGGGWFDSPQGAYVASQWQTGKANFGFVAKYENGAAVPTGQTQFRFDDLKFHSTQYEWLVIDGATAQYQGSGTINRDGDYGFRLTVLDGQVGGGEDTFRIKIWDKASNTVIYDNQLGAAQNSDPTTLLGGGSLVIHDGGEALHAAGGTSASIAGAMLSQAALAPVVDQAMSYWTGQGVGADNLAELRAIEVRVADLSPSVLGVASSSNLIWIDRDAAGYGWNVSLTAGGMNLLSVITHEFGHKLGFQHGRARDVMGASLAPRVQTLSVYASFPENLNAGQLWLLAGLDATALSRDSWQWSASGAASPDPFHTRWALSENLEDFRLRDEFFDALARDTDHVFAVESQLSGGVEGDIAADAMGREESLDKIEESLFGEDLLDEPQLIL